MTTFWILDVFAEAPYAGNQLAVVVQISPLPPEHMQRIAREFNFSETTFVTPQPRPDGCWPTRIFTPVHELPFAGHPTLGTATVIRDHLATTPSSPVRLALKAGVVPVRFDADKVAWLTPPRPQVVGQHSAEALARLLDLEIDDVDDRHPIEGISTGVPVTFVPLRNQKAVARARYRADQWTEADPDAVFVFCREPVDRDNHLHARFFAPRHGVPEDPATGSANACLALYLLRHNVVGPPPLALRVEQGYEMGRPSILRVNARGNEHEPEIEVGGRVHIIADGSLR